MVCSALRYALRAFIFRFKSTLLREVHVHTSSLCEGTAGVFGQAFIGPSQIARHSVLDIAPDDPGHPVAMAHVSEACRRHIAAHNGGTGREVVHILKSRRSR